jgi:hypothetical protein
VEHEHRTDQRAREHRDDRPDAPYRTRVRPAGERRVGGEAGERQREHGRGQVGRTQTPNGGVAQTHGGGSERDHRPPLPEGTVDRQPDRRHCGACEQECLATRGSHEPLTRRARFHRPRETPTAERTPEETTEREDRGADREPGRARDRERQEHHVAGHVRGEDTAQAEKAHRVDETRGDRQQEERRRKRVGCSPSVRPHVRLSSAISWGVSRNSPAATFSSRCATELVPGIGTITGERASSHASTTWRAVAP